MLSVATYSRTGIVTNPNEMVPLHTVRIAASFRSPSDPSVSRRHTPVPLHCLRGLRKRATPGHQRLSMPLHTLDPLGSSGAEAGDDRLAELLGPGELRPMACRQIDVVDVADLRKLLHVAISLPIISRSIALGNSHEMTVIGTS